MARQRRTSRQRQCAWALAESGSAKPSRGVIEASSASKDAEPAEEPVDEGSIVAWATFGAAMAEATETLERLDRDELVAVLDRLAKATRTLCDLLRASAGSG